MGSNNRVGYMGLPSSWNYKMHNMCLSDAGILSLFCAINYDMLHGIIITIKQNQSMTNLTCSAMGSISHGWSMRSS